MEATSSERVYDPELFRVKKRGALCIVWFVLAIVLLKVSKVVLFWKRTFLTLPLLLGNLGSVKTSFVILPLMAKADYPSTLLRRLDGAFGKDLDFWETPIAPFKLRKWIDQIEDFWERGPGAQPLNYNGHYHNLAVWGFEVQDAYQITAKFCEEKTSNPSDNWINQVPERSMLRTALRVLNPSRSTHQEDTGATQVSRAAQMAQKEGIENLIVFFGANNVLSTVTSLKYIKSTQKDLDEDDPQKREATIYTPEHFEYLLGKLVTKVNEMNVDGSKVERVFWGNVPFVTIPPVSQGIGGRMDSDKGLPSPYDNDDPNWFRRYFKYYTRPWIQENSFMQFCPKLTGEEVMQIDWTIAQYKKILKKKVDEHNNNRQHEGKSPDWFIADINWTLDRLAYRRYLEDSSVPPPPDWSSYEAPEAYRNLNLNTKFLRAKQGRRIEGGYFSLDGVHPTTVGYGIAAQEFINVMEKAGVQFNHRDGKTPRNEPILVDYNRLLRRDTLIGRSPLIKSLPFTLDDLWGKLEANDQLLAIFELAIRVFS